MRIGLVSPYDLGRFGGVQDQVRVLANALGARGHETVVVGPGATGPPRAVLVGNVTEVPGNGSVTPIALAPRAVTRALAALDGVDVVHLHEPLMPMISLGVLLRRAKPVVGTFHADPSALFRAGYRGLRRPLRRLLRRIDVITAVSPVAASAVEPIVPVRLIPNAVDVSAVAVANGRNQSRVAYLGRDDPRKGLGVLLEAWPTVKEAAPEAELIVVGSERTDAAPADVVFHGRVSEERKRSLLAASGVFCAPNTGGESFGVVVVEGMAAGCAVVASALPGFEYVLDGVGATVPPSHSNALAAALIGVLNDDTRRGAMQRSALARAQTFDVASVVTQYEAVYAEALGR